MSYYWFNRKEILQKAKERYSKEKAAEYYSQNKEAIKEKSKNQYKNLPKEEKELSGCRCKSSCSHLNFRFHACFDQGVP